MRGSGILGLLGAVVTALIIADLWRNSKVTDNLISASTQTAGLIAGSSGPANT
jgi:hypothetical protein